MDLETFKNSQKYDEILKMCVKRNKLSISYIQRKWKLSFIYAKQLFEEWKKYNDEVFFHNAIYEISFMDEVVTIPRIMNLLWISYFFAKRLFDYYIEVC